jgi:hypothetical protein
MQDVKIRHLSHLRVLLKVFLPGGIFLLACGLFSTVRSASSSIGDPARYRGGLRNSTAKHKLSPQQLDVVLKSLREKTGLTEMSFDTDGFLYLCDRTKFSGGSGTARALLAATVEASIALDLECHNYSSITAFARLARSVVYQSRATGASIDVYPMELDFSDFSKLRGDKRVLAAFDIGFVILHELGHAVQGLRDTSGSDDHPGECEEYINRIRRELNLPERQNYIARTFKTPFSVMRVPVEMAELVFAMPGKDQSSTKTFRLNWEAHLVGPVRERSELSAAKARNNKPVITSVNGQ